MKTQVAKWFLALGRELDSTVVPDVNSCRAFWLDPVRSSQVWMDEMYGWLRPGVLKN